MKIFLTKILSRNLYSLNNIDSIIIFILLFNNFYKNLRRFFISIRACGLAWI